jgi:aminoglycoside phosphotransferase (APT) family kinase protein
MNHADIISQLFPGAKLVSDERLTGGVSADVYKLDLKLADGTEKSVVLRAHGASHSGHAAELEYNLLQALHRSGVPVPEPLLIDASRKLLADPFLVMTFVEGTTEIPASLDVQYIDAMAETLASIHEVPVSGLPNLPARNDPIPEVHDYIPEDLEWDDLRACLQAQSDTAYQGSVKLLHGDYWPENLLWQKGNIAAILDWEDAAIGDPLSDLAVARVELRYKFGKPGMHGFTEAYARYMEVDPVRLALWEVYVAAAAQHFMGEWRLEPAREAHMRNEALASLREAGNILMNQV